MTWPRRVLPRLLLYPAVLLIAALVVPRWVCGRDSGDYYNGEPDAWLSLADEVAATTEDGIGSDAFFSGSERFDGEWAFGSSQMAVLGLTQVLARYPQKTDEYLPAIEACIDTMLAPQTRSFATAAWGHDGIAELDGGEGHAYLGYLNLALGQHRALVPDSRYAPLHDQLSAELARRVEASPTMLPETYPGEAYPVDVSSIIASLGVHGRVTGADHSELIQRWSANFRARYVDADSGLVVQAVHYQTGDPLDQPRASGTALAAYFLSFADMELSRELYRDGIVPCHRAPLGFGAVKEYAPGSEGGWGDIDSGPVVLSFGTSATGFTLASARIHQDPRRYRQIVRTAHLFGAPVHRDGRSSYVTGGPLGNAILLAMLTAGGAP